MSDGLNAYNIEYKGGEFRICLKDPKATFYHDQDAIAISLPILFRQIIAITILSSTLTLILKPFHQPRFIGDIIGGIILGPSFLGLFRKYNDIFLPFASATILESFTYLGGVYYVFLVGLEMNQTPILRISRKAMAVAAAGIVVPLAVGFGTYFLIAPSPAPNGPPMGPPGPPKAKTAFLWGVALTGTNLPELTRILADLKLLRMDVGRTALSSAFLSEIGTWMFLAIVITTAHDRFLAVAASSIGFILMSIFAIRPFLSWLIRTTSDPEEDYKETHVHFVFCGVLLFGFISDGLGLSSIFGAFLFGFILPGGHLATAVRERLEKITSWILTPLYCILLGLKCNFQLTAQGVSAANAALFIVLSWASKFFTTFFVALRCQMAPRDASALAVLMNTKGMLSAFVINIGRDYKLLIVENFTVMILTLVVMTATVPIIIKYAYKPQKQMTVHRYKSIQSTGIDSPLRILVCIHSARDIRGTIYLLQLSHGTRQYPIRVFAVHLVELTERTSATMLVVQGAYRSNSTRSTRAIAEAESEQIVEAFEEYQMESDNTVTFEALTALSPYATMHVDVCSIAEDKRANLLIVPFHVQGGADANADNISSSARMVNQKVMAYAPCSVGLLVNRGLGMSNQGVTCLIMFFIGGPDDREALSYAWRMSALPEVHLTVVRFIAGDHAEPMVKTTFDLLNEERGSSTLITMQDRQEDLDEEFMGDFKYKTMNNNSISYTEEVVNNGEETLRCIRNNMEQHPYEMCIVGQGDQQTSPLLSGLSSLVEFEELGPIGDAIATSNFAPSCSILVMQQYYNRALRSKKADNDKPADLFI
ncbi:hypothetical protein MLD38_037040 [Melastoma candidum]|uniref:Uncharacterized protein n=1 Tax=Melastoma candidum TaxID=119954 RepID=A0ACB9LLS5_9MYRT|nr:hypothetical protein MLD38_037040 [Melastoma candidum]